MKEEMKNLVLIATFDSKLVMLDVDKFLKEHAKDDLSKITCDDKDLVTLYNSKDEIKGRFGKYIFSSNNYIDIINALLTIVNNIAGEADKQAEAEKNEKIKQESKKNGK